MTETKVMISVCVTLGMLIASCNVDEQCDGMKARGRCVGSEMQHCDDSDYLDFWVPFLDCAEYNLSCRSSFSHGIEPESGGNGNSTGLYCVDESIQCENSGDLKCSSDGKYLLECREAFVGSSIVKFAALIEEYNESSFCWISEKDSIPRQVFIEGSCENEETICNEDLIITCVDGFWTSSINCSPEGKSCVESDGKSICE